MKKYIWLNLNTGQFSYSWTQEDMDRIGETTDTLLQGWDTEGWKLIEYSCVNDPEFSFYDRMKLK